MSHTLPPSLIFKGECANKIEICTSGKHQIQLTICVNNEPDMETFVTIYLHESTAQAFKKHLGWVLAELKTRL